VKHFTYGKIESPQFREASSTKARHMSASFVTPQTQTAPCHALNEAHILPPLQWRLARVRKPRSVAHS